MFRGVLLQEMLRNEPITEGKMETKDMCVGVCTCECLCSSVCAQVCVCIVTERAPL